MPEQIELVPVTVYEVVETGLTITGLITAPVFHEYVVPPDAVNVAVCPEQMVSEFTVITGSGFTVTVEIAVPEQPAVVPVTVYEVVAEGVSVIGFVVAPVDQEYVVPPPALSVAVCPAQIVGELTVIEMLPPTVTVAVAVPVHAPLVPVTVYEVVVEGETVIGLPTAPFDQE